MNTLTMINRLTYTSSRIGLDTSLTYLIYYSAT